MENLDNGIWLNIAEEMAHLPRSDFISLKSMQAIRNRFETLQQLFQVNRNLGINGKRHMEFVFARPPTKNER